VGATGTAGPRRSSGPGRADGPGDAPPRPPLPARLVRRLVTGLPSGLLVLDADDAVVLANPAAHALGVVARDGIDSPVLAALIAEARASGDDQDTVFDVPPRAEAPLTRPRPDRESTAIRARTMRLGGDGHIAIVLDDVSENRRVDAVRRDFVANVSHELKTPVGALHVLAEAVAAASEDPVAVRRFASRMTHESSRLARLVQEIIDLSRLQGADPLPDPVPVSVAGVLAEALDRTRLAAQTREIAVAVIGAAEHEVLGDEGQLATAVANLIDNAVTYSPQGTRVVVGVRLVESTVEISVADEGIGIAEKDLERVFERFYRADPARSRATGGTGLGLAIVKHVATNHGGSVGVWSAEGAGSTFTLRLPVHAAGGSPTPSTEPSPSDADEGA
jgi:two-component system sensor histidine kinase SenX3